MNFWKKTSKRAEPCFKDVRELRVSQYMKVTVKVEVLIEHPQRYKTSVTALPVSLTILI